jgi:hypothetical protein
MDRLGQTGYFTPPDIVSLEKVLEHGIGLEKGRVFADTWDIRLFSSCDICLGERVQRLTEMNLSQQISAPVKCSCMLSAPV